MPTDDEFPGFRTARDIFEIWRTSLGTQADTWNRAWRDIKTENYDFGKWIKDVATVHEENFKTAEKIARYPTATTVNEQTPTWVNFDLRNKSPINNEDLSQVVQTRTYNSTIVTATVLAPFGASTARVKITAERIGAASTPGTAAPPSAGKTSAPADRILVKIIEIDDGGGPYDPRTTPIPKAHLGPYLGMVTVQDPTARSEPPLAIVTLVL